MKRWGRLRAKSKKNSRPHENRDLRAAYLTLYYYDEWRFELGVVVIGGKLWTEESGKYVDACDPNHIFSLNQRPDFEANLISLTRESHDWFHAHLREGRVLCVLSKLKKSERRGEVFDIEAINKAAGKSVLGTIDGYEFTDERMRLWQMECVGRLVELKGAKC